MNNILTEPQSGFRKQHITMTSIGMSGHTVVWFVNYLYERSQCDQFD